MSPFLLFLLAVITPFLLLFALLGPIYVGMCGAEFIIYYPNSGPHPLQGKWLDVFSIFETFQQLSVHWLDHMGTLSLLHFTLPLIGLPLIGLAISLYTLRRLLRWLANTFHQSVGGH